MAEGFEMPLNSPGNFNKFCDVIGEDGVMVLKLIGANSSDLVVRDVVCNMWIQDHPSIVPTVHVGGASGSDDKKIS